MAFDWDIDPTVAAVLGLCAGTLCAIGLCAAPFNTFVRIVRQKSTEDFSGFPYVSALLNCGVWSIYTLPQVTPNRLEPLITNAFGFITQAGYTGLFLFYAPKKVQKSNSLQAAGVLAFLVTLLAVSFEYLTQPQRNKLVGVFAVVFTTLMYGSPLAAMSLVLRTKSVHFMPFWLSFNSLATSVIWLLYAIYVKDVLMSIPNVLGTFLGIFQMVLYFSIRGSEVRRSGYQEVASGPALPTSRLS